MPLTIRDNLLLAELIPRILFERRLFLDITEASLEQEIEQGQTPEETEVYPLTPQEDDSEDPLERFNRQTMDLTKNINLALNETQLSLDFVLLLLLLIRQLDKMTISPHLQKNVPMGSLSSDRLVKNLSSTDLSSELDKDGQRVGRGWKMELHQKVIDLFSQSHKDLLAQLEKEKQYWSQVNVVVSNREVLFKTREPDLNQRAIGVKYGYGDLGLSYHDKGLAILRKVDDTGEVKFTPVTSLNRVIEKTFKYVRVRILSKIDGIYSLTGQLQFKYEAHEAGLGLIYDIDKARYFLFEEDLFYQLTREAKTLINYNVNIISDKIILEVNDEIIEFELVAYDEATADDLDYLNVNQYSSINNVKCQKILVYLKIMLCCYYKYNLLLKQKMPTTLTKWKQSHSHPLILRPLLGNIRHELDVNRIVDILHKELGEFNPEIKAEKYTNLEVSRPRATGDNPFQKLVERPHLRVTAVVSHATNQQKLKIQIELTTNENFVNLIMKLNITKFPDAELMNKNLNGVNALAMSFNDFNDIGECLGWLVRNFVDE